MLPPDLADRVAWNPGNAERYLLAAGGDDVAVLQAIVATLPLCARGQVFVEVDDAEHVGRLETPGRVTVCWLVRDGEPGARLSRAVDGWLSEMAPGRGYSENSIYAWIAGEGAAHRLNAR